MKNIFKIMLIITFGVFFLSSCEEGETSMPEMKPGAVKNLQVSGDLLLLLENPAAFTGSVSLDVISESKVDHIDLSVVFSTASGSIAPDTVLVSTVTNFPYEFNIDLQWFADMFPASSNYILNSLEGGDNFKFITGNVFLADGTEIFEEYVFNVQDVSEETGNDTIVELEVAGKSPALVNIETGYWPQHYTYYVGCPFDPEEAAGTYEIVKDNWWEQYYQPELLGQTVEVVAGPGANQITIIDPFKHDELFGTGPYDIVVTVDPLTVIVADISRQTVMNFENPGYGWGYGDGFVEGQGLALSCIGVIDLRWELTVAAGSFGTFSYGLQKL